jgi:1-acyl-sn-glycerol-3-phosphate acyltransferase
MYKLLVGVIRFFVKLLWGLEVEGLENVPKEGGAVVAANHTTWFDPVAMAIAFERPIHFMGKAELFKIPILRWFLFKLHVFPVKRGLADREAIREAQERVSSGELLGIFPEGTRNKTEETMLPLQGGAALISLKTGAPIVPVVITGVKHSRFRHPMKVTIGSTIDLGGPKRANKPEIALASSVISEQFSALIRRNN